MCSLILVPIHRLRNTLCVLESKYTILNKVYYGRWRIEHLYEHQDPKTNDQRTSIDFRMQNNRIWFAWVKISRIHATSEACWYTRLKSTKSCDIMIRYSENIEDSRHSEHAADILNWNRPSPSLFVLFITSRNILVATVQKRFKVVAICDSSVPIIIRLWSLVFFCKFVCRNSETIRMSSPLFLGYHQ